jgi:hypothetical protein
MISTRLTVIALLAAAGAGGAQAADGGGRLELCIETARGADADCAKLSDDPTQRLQCFSKARDAQLDCLERALAEAPSGTAMPERRSTSKRPQPPANAASRDATAQTVPKENPLDNSPERASGNAQATREANAPATEPPSGSIPPKEPVSAAQAKPEAAPSPAPSPEAPSATMSKEPTSAAQATPQAVPSPAPSPEAPSATTSPKEPTSTARAAPQTAPSPAPSAAPAAAAGPVQTETPKMSQRPARPPESRWVVSETTSAIDYSPLLTAVIRASSGSPGGPVSFAVRCRGGQTTLLIRTEGTWRATRRNVLPVDFQVNDQSTERQTWTLQSDGKIATYADDPVELLRSLPDGGRLSVSVSDGAEAHQQATFLLTGWDTVRARVETACRWPKMMEHASSGKR